MLITPSSFSSRPRINSAGALGDLSVTLPTALGDNHVDQAGLVLEVEEGRALGGGRPLTMGDDPTDEHPLP